MTRLPPAPFYSHPVKEQQTPSLRFQTQAMCNELLSLTALRPRQFLFRSGHTDHGQGMTIALNIPIQPLDQRQGIGFVGLNSLAQLIPVLWTNHDVLDAQTQQSPMQAVAQRTGFVTTVNA